ncbi:ATP-dependent DNA helicase RecG [Candidatus Nitrosacidococcus tergens]|uniref:ATP-dependent DNA helicase RecG n=1 Tax=Candidatus Nitrosacidococcus tergens TaxID=553981 RepID=A0A7G1QB42_9GAMM|nr:ATP-dependent DNA helicase RecG [Candidatus Nitrosacidococcus tergens]CAB1277002.1 ATP-dependent DNA helicase [Candidatus Nitrosacidococcus tergens]
MPLSTLANKKYTSYLNCKNKENRFLQTLISDLEEIKPSTIKQLAKLGLYRVQDLLFHLPQRYQDKTRITPIGNLQIGTEALIQGKLTSSYIYPGRQSSLFCCLTDNTGSISLRFFHFSYWQKKLLILNAHIRCFGEIRQGAKSLELIHPEWMVLRDKDGSIESHLTPIYPTTNGLSQTTLRYLIQRIINELNTKEIEENLSTELLKFIHLPSLHQAISYLHQPPPDASIALLTEGKHPTQQRLAFDELLAHRLALKQLKLHSYQLQAPVLQASRKLIKQFLTIFPFALTQAQQRVTEEILGDIAKNTPMQRLLQGDVGSGKTIVAAFGVLQAVETGYQAALMVPTELLAEQHLAVFQHWVSPLGIKVERLPTKGNIKARRQCLMELKQGDIHLIIGTHVLFQEEVIFHNLGLVVIDEQHRFGVTQRLALLEKGQGNNYCPHQLIMTATPIPRTLAMATYGDFNTSIIDQLPPGRSPIMTVAIPDFRRNEVIIKIREACREGKQVYWVCTLVEESETLQAQAAEKVASDLNQLLPELNIGLVHGRLKPQEKESVMTDFRVGNIKLLVATTVIEVGVDVPNASLMVIENAERLGLSQLHQLRGRVGRSTERSYCILLYHGPLSKLGRARLDCLRTTQDGFEIARLDLELRGPGILLGTRQTGLISYRVANLLRDQDLLAKVDQVADKLIAQYPHYIPKIIYRWLGEGSRYKDV